MDWGLTTNFGAKAPSIRATGRCRLNRVPGHPRANGSTTRRCSGKDAHAVLIRSDGSPSSIPSNFVAARRRSNRPGKSRST